MFKTLYNLPDFPNTCVKESMNARYEQSYKPDQLRAFSSFNNTKFVKDLQNKFGKCGGLYMKNKPMTLYDWHTDIGRQCSVNWLILNEQGSAYYRDLIPAKDGFRSITYNLTAVEYKLYKPTILDVTKEHCVFNPTENDRIIFSLSIDAPFDDVYSYLSSLNIEKY